MRAARETTLLAVLCLLAGAAASCRASDASEVAGILDNWQSNQGGLGPGTFVASYAIQEKVQVKAAASSETDSHILRTRAGHFRLEFNRSTDREMVYGFDGDIGWTARPGVGFSLLPLSAKDPIVWQSDLFLGLDLVPPNATHFMDLPAKVAGVDCLVVGVSIPRMADATCYFDRKTRQLIRVVRPQYHSVIGSHDTTIDIGDFRKVGKLTVPFLIRIDDGSVVITHVRSEVAINVPVDEGSFVLSSAQVAEANKVSAIIARQAATIGGPEAFGKIHTRVTKLKVSSPTTGIVSMQTVSQMAPNLVVVQSVTPGMGWESRGYDGKAAWFSSEIEGSRLLTPVELGQLMYSTSINPLGQIAVTCPYRRLIGERLVSGRVSDALSLAPASGPPASYYFDRESGRLVRVSSVIQSAGSQSGWSIEFGDYRDVDGVGVPFLVTTENPTMKTVSAVESVTNNVRVDPALFQQPKDD